MIGMYGPLKVYVAQADRHGNVDTTYVRACNMLDAIRLLERYSMPPLDEPESLSSSDPRYIAIAPFLVEQGLLTVDGHGEVWSYDRSEGVVQAEQIGTLKDSADRIVCLEKGPGVELARKVRQQSKRRRTVIGRARSMANLLGEQYDRLDRQRQHGWAFLAYCYGLSVVDRPAVVPILQAIQLSRIDNPASMKDPTVASRLFLDLPKERQLQFMDAADKLKSVVG